MSQWLRELFNRRDVLMTLLWKDTKVQYGNWWLGIMWSLFQPITYLIAAMVFMHLSGRTVDQNEMPMPLFLFSGIIVWNMFTSGVNSASNVMRANANLITKASFPRAYIIMTPVVRATSDFLLSFVILVFVSLLLGHAVDFHSFGNILFIMIIMIFTTLSIGTLLAIAVLHQRHLLHAIPILLYALLFMLPVFHEINFQEGEIMSYIYATNPPAVSIRLMREMIHGDSVPTAHTALAMLSAVFLLIISTIIFRKNDRLTSDML